MTTARGLSDFRSDTVTKPTPDMRRAMAEADVGDDVFGEDPTVRRLEERTADVLGFPSALFVPSGSMGNQIALRVHARSGTEVILESRSHILNYEMAGMASLSGLLARPVAGERGLLSAEAIEPSLRPDDVYYLPRTSLIALENTHNMAGGRVMERDRVDPILALARGRGIPVHLDGARLWNAAARLGRPESELASGFDSAMVCFSKGLRAPIGSAVVGSREFIAEARRVRKLFGGGLRQAGVIAAAALVALENERERLVVDHVRASTLAERLSTLPGLGVEPPETNIVLVRLNPARGRAASDVLSRLKERGVLAVPTASHEIRFVTHADVGDEHVEWAAAAMAEVLQE